MFSPVIDELIQALCCLPGVGRKSAQRMALHLLERDREGAERLAKSLGQSLEKVDRCKQCRTLTEEPVCRICASQKRSATQLCVVETPADIIAIEQSGVFQGKYFVLLGHLSPIDGIGPDDIGIPVLSERLINELAQGVPLGGELEYIDGGTLAHALSSRRPL